MSPNPAAFKSLRTLAVDSFINIVGQNWPRNARLCTPLRHTVTQRGLPPRWPQLSHIAWFSEKSYIYLTIKRRFPATRVNLGANFRGENWRVAVGLLLHWCRVLFEDDPKGVNGDVSQVGAVLGKPMLEFTQGFLLVHLCFWVARLLCRDRTGSFADVSVCGTSPHASRRPCSPRDPRSFR